MRSRPAKINRQIEQLILSKNFAELTAAEVRILEGRFSSETYAVARKTLLAATDMFARDLPLPSAKVKTNLLKVVAAQREKSTNENWWSTLLNYPVPAWQPALGVSLVLLYFFIPWTGTENIHDPNAMITQKSDVVVAEVPGYLAASVPVASVPSRRKNRGSISGDLNQKTTILDTLKEVTQTLQRTLRPVANRLSVPTMHLSNMTLASNDTVDVRPQTMEQYWIDPVNIMAVQDQSRRLVSF